MPAPRLQNNMPRVRRRLSPVANKGASPQSLTAHRAFLVRETCEHQNLIACRHRSLRTTGCRQLAARAHRTIASLRRPIRPSIMVPSPTRWHGPFATSGPGLREAPLRTNFSCRSRKRILEARTRLNGIEKPGCIGQNGDGRCSRLQSFHQKAVIRLPGRACKHRRNEPCHAPSKSRMPAHEP